MPTRKAAFASALEWLTEHLGVQARAGDRRTDELHHATVGTYRFTLSWASSGAVGPVAQAVERLKRTRASDRIHVVVVPFMGDAGAARCARADVGWLDLSGNASLRGPGLRVQVLGNPNRFVRRGRPANPFAAKSARVARWLLIHPRTAWRQRDLAEAIGLSDGAVSKVVRAYEEQGLVARDATGAVRAADPPRLLDAWRERYRFDRHRLRAGTVAARSGVELTRRIGTVFGSADVRHAFTGLAAAWGWDGFASFRTVAVYGDTWPERSLDDLGFVEEPRGANLWVITPDDEGVFHGGATRDGVSLVHPVQTYLDLGAQAERASEAADHLRTHVLNALWRGDA